MTPTRFSADLGARIVGACLVGAPLRQCAAFHGVPWRTFCAWRKAGRAGDPELAAWAAQIDSAEAKLEATLWSRAVKGTEESARLALDMLRWRAASRTRTPRRDARTAARRTTALELRAQGLTLEAIGARLGITRQSVHELLRREMAAAAETRRDLAEHQLEIDLAAIDAILAGLSTRIADGDPQAGATALRALERRARLLGIDAPTKTDLTSGGQSLHDAHAALAAALAGLAAEPGAVGTGSAPRESAAGDG